jgi:hypothetical protein
MPDTDYITRRNRRMREMRAAGASLSEVARYGKVSERWAREITDFDR